MIEATETAELREVRSALEAAWHLMDQSQRQALVVAISRAASCAVPAALLLEWLDACAFEEAAQE